MAVDLKYGEVQTELGNIGDMEPVVVFRAQDELLPAVLAFYLQLCMLAGSPMSHIHVVLQAFEGVRRWQEATDNSTKVPD